MTTACTTAPRSQASSYVDTLLNENLATIKQAIEKMIEAKEKTSDLQTMSEVLRDGLQNVGAGLIETALNDAAQKGPAKAPCPLCKRPCGVHSRHPREISTLQGKSTYTRAYH